MARNPPTCPAEKRSLGENLVNDRCLGLREVVLCAGAAACRAERGLNFIVWNFAWDQLASRLYAATATPFRTWRYQLIIRYYVFNFNVYVFYILVSWESVLLRPTTSLLWLILSVPMCIDVTMCMLMLLFYDSCAMLALYVSIKFLLTYIIWRLLRNKECIVQFGMCYHEGFDNIYLVLLIFLAVALVVEIRDYRLFSSGNR